MIARADLHRKGYGRAALVAFLSYIDNNWPSIAHEYPAGDSRFSEESFSKTLAYLRVKINHGNLGSIALFQSIGFETVSTVPNIFGEIEMRKNNLKPVQSSQWYEELTLLAYDDQVK